jgi:hypothetical protein
MYNKCYNITPWRDSNLFLLPEISGSYILSLRMQSPDRFGILLLCQEWSIVIIITMLVALAPRIVMYIFKPLYSWQEARGARHGFLDEKIPYNRQDRSQDLWGNSPVQEDGIRGKAGEKPMERIIIPG